VIGVYVHCTLHWPAVPVRTFVVQAIPSSQVAGQFPSHVSMPSTTPFPQLGEQSLSFVALHPGAQQPSPFVHVVIAGWVHCRLHWAALPTSTSFVQEFPSFGHVLGQLPSQSSPISTMPLPQTGMQPSSLFALQPGPQQPSPAVHVVIAGWLHTTLQDEGSPLSTSRVQVLPSSAHVAGQFPSHVSLPWTMPSPQKASQLSSSSKLHPTGQQPSPS
jgi:hypothetical protein